MNFKIAPMFPFKVIGFQKVFDNESAYAEIPKFWNETCEKYAYSVYAGNAPANPYEQALVDNYIGEYGICIDDVGGGKFRYLIAGKYTGGTVPEGMVVYEFPRNEWAVFNCIGPNPQTLQSMNTRIFSEWLPGNPDYELSGNATVEWYDCVNGEMSDPDYHSAFWVPVKKKTSFRRNENNPAHRQQADVGILLQPVRVRKTAVSEISRYSCFLFSAFLPSGFCQTELDIERIILVIEPAAGIHPHVGAESALYNAGP